MIEAMSREQNWRALFRPVLREENIRSRTQENQIKPTQAICRGLWAQKKHKPVVRMDSKLVLFDCVAVVKLCILCYNNEPREAFV